MITTEQLDAVFSMHYPSLVRLAARFSRDGAGDIVHQAFINARNMLGNLRDDENLPGWLSQQVRWTALSWLRAQRRLRGRTEQLQEEVPAHARQASTLDQVHAEDLRRRIMAKVPPIYREALNLLLQGFEYREIAELVGIPIGTVMSRLARGREAARKAVLS